MSSKRPGRIRLAVDIPEDMHSKIKFCAKNRNITMTKWIMRACFGKLKEENILDEHGVDKDLALPT